MGKKDKKDENVEQDIEVKDKEAQTEENTTEETVNQEETKEDTSKESPEVTKLKAQVEDLEDKYRRLLAEFDNFRKRTNREKLELIKTASKDTLTGLLPVLDDFDRAKKNHDDDGSEEHFTEGVSLLYMKLQTYAEKQGLQAIDPTGEAFDADFHEAITEIPAPTEELKGKVIDTVERGYSLNDKIIRYAKVVIGK